MTCQITHKPYTSINLFAIVSPYVDSCIHESINENIRFMSVDSSQEYVVVQQNITKHVCESLPRTINTQRLTWSNQHRSKPGQHLQNFDEIESNDSSNIIIIMKQEYEGHGEIEQGIESHLLGCDTQRPQTSFLKLFPHLNSKIHVMFHTSSSLSISKLS